MSQQFDAIYEHGVLRPITPLNLPELAEVTGTLQTKNAGELSPTINPLLGLMADDSELLDDIVSDAMTPRVSAISGERLMDEALLDTDIFSEILKAKNENVVRRADVYRRKFGRYTVSTVTITEIVKGFRKRNREDHIQGLLAGLATEKVLEFDLGAAVIAGRIYGDLEKAGQTIGRADPLIAGLAVAKKLVLVTGNTKHFERIVALGFPLSLADWCE